MLKSADDNDDNEDADGDDYDNNDNDDDAVANADDEDDDSSPNRVKSLPGLLKKHNVYFGKFIISRK